MGHPIESPKKLFVKSASRDGVVDQGRILSSTMPVSDQGVEKVENLPLMRQPQYTRLGSDKDSKPVRAPPKRLRINNTAILAGGRLTSKPVMKTGELDDDHEELKIAARSVHSAREEACSSPFWKKMEGFFASLTPEDLQLLKLRLAEELNQSQSRVFDDECHASGSLMHSYSREEHRPFDHGSVRSASSSGGLVTGSSPVIVPSLFQRVLSALIDEDEGESEDCYDQKVGRNVSSQFRSKNSHCDSYSSPDCDLKDGERLATEFDSDVNLHLQSTDNWQADDGLQDSSMEFLHGNDKKNPTAIRSSEVGRHPVSSFNCQYQMSLEDRLLLELQRIGLCPDTLPQLEDKEEWIDQEIKELKENLYQQAAKVKKILKNVDKAIQHGQDLEKRNVEEVAVDQLTLMAYKRMACWKSKSTRSKSNSARRNGRKITKQATLAFVERTLARCKQYEDTGRSCFSEPSLQDIMFSAPLCEQDVKLNQSNGSKIGSICGEARKKSEPSHSGTGHLSGAFDKLDSQHHKYPRGFSDSQLSFTHSSELSSGNDLPVIQGKKNELLIDPNAVVASSKAEEASTIADLGGLHKSFSDAEQALSHSPKQSSGHDIIFYTRKRKGLDEIGSGAPSKIRQIMSKPGGLELNRGARNRELERENTTTNSASVMDHGGNNNKSKAKSKPKISSSSGHQEHSPEPSADKS